MRNLSARFGIFDVALKKTCARAGIPTPDRGYWAKKEAGKEAFQAVLPMRPPGMDDEVSIASGGNGSYQYWSEEEILGFVGAPPQFAEPIESVPARIAENESVSETILRKGEVNLRPIRGQNPAVLRPVSAYSAARAIESTGLWRKRVGVEITWN
jgi:hypothetical protein